MMNFTEFLAEQEPKTLYVSRPVFIQDAEKIVAWAKSQGFEKTLQPNDMHITIAFSREPVVWTKWPRDLTIQTVQPGGRSVAALGDKGAIVLKVQGQYLQDKWQKFIDGGASWDYDSYTPHITITYDGSNVDLTNVVPYQGPVLLRGEQWAEVKLDWDKTVKET